MNNIQISAREVNLSGIKPYRFFYERYMKELSSTKAGRLIAELCKGKKSYNLYHVIDVYRNGEPVDRRLFRADRTLNRLLKEAREKNLALLYRGVFAVPEEVWEEYRKNYQTANRFEIFRLEKLTQMAPYILIDLDGVSFEDLKRVVSYFQKLGIYPDVWESASGKGNYHIYIRLTGRVERRIRKVKDEETGEERTEEHILHYLSYASDYRIKLVVEAVKEIFRRLEIPYDSISAIRAVWLEDFPNPEKGGRASRKIWSGKVHRLDKLHEKLRTLWKKAISKMAGRKNTSSFRTGTGTCEVVPCEHSNPIDYLQKNIETAFRMLDRGYAWTKIERELRAEWKGDEKAFERAFSSFKSWIEAHYRPLTRKTGQKRHKHYWEYIPAIYRALRKGLTSIRAIARETGVPKSSIYDIFKIVSKEQILKDPNEAQKLLKTYQKGGRRESAERWDEYLEQFLRESFRRKPVVEPVIREESFYESVRIGSISITPSLRKESREVDGNDEPTEEFTRPDINSYEGRFTDRLSDRSIDRLSDRIVFDLTPPDGFWSNQDDERIVFDLIPPDWLEPDSS